MPQSGVSVSPGRTYRGDEDHETADGVRRERRRRVDDWQAYDRQVDDWQVVDRHAGDRQVDDWQVDDWQVDDRHPDDSPTDHRHADDWRTDHWDADDRPGRAVAARLASMADVTAELEFAPRPRPRRVSGPAAPRRRAAASGARPAAAPVRGAGLAAAPPEPVRAIEPELATYPAEPPAPVVPGAGIAGRRTVTIHGRGAERYTPPTQRRRPSRRPHEREGFRPDRVAMWAVMLGFILVLVAATSSHAAAIGHRAVGAQRAGAAQRQAALVRHGATHHTVVRAGALRVR